MSQSVSEYKVQAISCLFLDARPRPFVDSSCMPGGTRVHRYVEFLASFQTDFSPIELILQRKLGLLAQQLKLSLRLWSVPIVLWARSTTSHTDWMSGAKKDSTVHDSHQLAASQKKRAGRGKLLLAVLYNTGKLYSPIFRRLWTTSNE